MAPVVFVDCVDLRRERGLLEGRPARLYSPVLRDPVYGYQARPEPRTA